MYRKILLTIVLIFIINFTRGRTNSEISIVPIVGPFSLSEGPHWDEYYNILYFVDIYDQKLYSWDAETNELTYTYIKNGPVGVAVPIDGKVNTYIVGSGRDLIEISWDRNFNDTDPAIKIIQSVEKNHKLNRFNDGKVDPKGRFWAGTMVENSENNPSHEASLYKFNNDGTFENMIGSITISNGLVWNHDNDTFYYIDSPQKKVFVYDYDNESGNISNKRTLFDFKQNGIFGVPDGMTIDCNGNLWVAENLGSGKVLQINPNSGELLRSINMPVTLVSSVAFGGPHKDILYVTSMAKGLTKEQLKNQPLAGFVFAVHGLEVSGTSMRPYKLEN